MSLGEERSRNVVPASTAPVTVSLGLPRVHHRLTDSTNERAKELAAKGAPHGTIVTADEQSAGRGRQGRAWMAEAGSALLVSVVLHDLDERSALLPLTTAVAVCEAAEACAPVTCAIKWPNDVWVERKKLAGILVEGRPQEGWAVAGVGLNVSGSPGELADLATSLALESLVPGPRSPAALLDALLVTLNRRLSDDPARVLRAWRARDALKGSRISWRDGEGEAAGIDDSGALLVETADGRVALQAGEVHLSRVT